MLFGKIPTKYSSFEAWAHDHIIADRALNMHAYILEQTNLEEILTQRKTLKLLDVGCGGGQLPIWLKERYPHLELTGIDLSTDQVRRARRRTVQKGYDIRFSATDAQSLPFPGESFDVVYSFGSAKHWPDPAKGLGECWRVLRPGGELLVADATSDATRESITNFFRISGFPRILEKPAIAIMKRLMFRPARSVEAYRQIAAELGMPTGTVSQVPSMPAVQFRAQKPC